MDYIINLAALIGIPYSYVASKNYIDVNISGAHNLLELAKNSNIERLIQTSTSEVYGTAQFIPMSEKHLLIHSHRMPQLKLRLIIFVCRITIHLVYLLQYYGHLIHMVQDNLPEL